MPALTEEMVPVMMEAAERLVGMCDCGGKVVWSLLMLRWSCNRCSRTLDREQVDAGVDPGHDRALPTGLALDDGPKAQT